MPKSGVIMYQVTSPFWQMVDHWQTLITGIMAVLAAAATIYFTREFAQWQVEAAKAQIKTVVEIERAKSIGERSAFLTMLAAAMETVIRDVDAARGIISPALGPGESVAGYVARQRIKKTAFADIRAALVGIADQSTAAFLKLDNAIDDFSSQWQEFQGTAGNKLLKGFHAGISDQCAQIEEQASLLLRYAKEAQNKLHAP